MFVAKNTGFSDPDLTQDGLSTQSLGELVSDEPIRGGQQDRAVCRDNQWNQTQYGSVACIRRLVSLTLARRRNRGPRRSLEVGSL